MNSSISSSKSWDWFKILLLLLVALVALEVGTRAVLVRLSKDLSRFASYPAQAERLASERGSRIALVGNSATDLGVDPEEVERVLRGRAIGEVHVASFVAHASGVQDWYYMTQEYFVRPNYSPDLIVMNVFPNCLEDYQILEIGRLARYFARDDDWRAVCADLPSLSERIRYVFSKFWLTFAFSDRINRQILARVCPDYKAFAKRLNDEARTQIRPQGASGAKTGAFAGTGGRYTGLRRFLDFARRHRLRVCFVDFPTLPETGGEIPDLSAESRDLIRRVGYPILDLRRVEGLNANHYDDHIHMNPEGRAIYSRRLAEAIAPLIVPGAG